MKPRAMSEKQRWLLERVRRATDGETALQRSGEATVGGLCARGSTIASLVRRGFVAFGGVCAEVDGDGYTTADDTPRLRRGRTPQRRCERPTRTARS